jgi:hypothetical protein
LRNDGEHSDLVDEFYRPFLRALGNLVISFAQSEAALLDLVSEFNGGDEAAAVKALKAPDAKDQLLAFVNQVGLRGFDLDELLDGVRSYWEDKEIRNRLMHDQWYPNPDSIGSVGTRGFTRARVPKEIFRTPTVEEVWLLARRFQEYDDIFSHRSHMIRRNREEG